LAYNFPLGSNVSPYGTISTYTVQLLPVSTV